MVAASLTEAGGGASACDVPGDGVIGSPKRKRGERGGRLIRIARARKAAQAIGAAAAAPADRTQVPGTCRRGRRGRAMGRRPTAGTPAKRVTRDWQYHRGGKGKSTGKGKGKGGKGKRKGGKGKGKGKGKGTG